MGDPIFSLINRAVHEAKEQREVGMQVGLGKVRLDISQVEHLLKHYASLQSENAALREQCDALAKHLRPGVGWDGTRLHGQLNNALIMPPQEQNNGV